MNDRDPLQVTASGYDRRAFLRRAGLLGAAGAFGGSGLLGAVRPAAAADDELAPFLHGVASGDPTASSVVLWTRVRPPDDGGVVPVTWEISADPGFEVIVDRGSVDASSAVDWTVKVTAEGLSPFAYHWYRFRAGGVTSIVGRTKTAPASGQAVDRLRLGLVSCSNYEGGYFNAYARLAERNDLDAILCPGDYLYEYGQGGYGPGAEIGRVVEPPLEMTTLADYRARFAHYRLDPDLRRLHQLYPWITTWDDHETTNDSWRGGAENHNPEGDFTGADDNEEEERGLDWEERKRRAWKAYREWLPVAVDSRSMDEPIVLYRSLAYGDLADIVVLDTRIEGRDQQVFEVLEPGITETQIEAEDRRLISPSQQAFLEGELSGSTSIWRIVLQQVMLMQWRIPALPEGLAGAPDFPNPLITSGGNAVNGDAWDGYAAERRRLFSHLRADDITDVVVLTGDIHTTWAADLTEDPLDPTGYDPTGANPAIGRNLGVEFVCPSITSDNIDEILIEEGAPPETAVAMTRSLEAATLANNPHIKTVNLDRHGYGIVDVTAERTTYDVFFVEQLQPTDDETFHESWYVEKSGPEVLGHRVIQGDGPTATRTGVPEAPSALPEPAPAAAPPVADDRPVLPATGGRNALLAGGAAAVLGAVIARRAARD